MKQRDRLSEFLGIAVLISLVSSLFGLPVEVQAGGLPSMLYVDTTIDSNLAEYQVCDTDITNSNCSLRGAISLVNSDTTTPKDFTIILMAATYTFSPLGSPDEDFNHTGDLDVALPDGNSLTIVGVSQAGTVIDANHVDRVFDQHGPGGLILNMLTIRNGQIATGKNGGAGVRNILNAVLWLSRVTVESNRVLGSDGSLDVGGGIHNVEGILNIIDSTIRNNEAVSGGGIEASNTSLWMEGCTVSGNIANDSFGGGLDLGVGSNYTILESRILGNHANNGGGLYTGGSTVLTLVDSTISGNTTDLFGGGMMLFGSVILTRVTVSGNSVPVGAYGGGIYIGGNTPYTNVGLFNVTITDNTALYGAGLFTEAGTNISFNHVTDGWNNLYPGGIGSAIYIGGTGNGIFTYQNSIFQHSDTSSTSLTCDKNPGSTFTYTDLGYNLFDLISTCFGIPAAIGDITGLPAGLSSMLGYYGGHTPVLAIYPSGSAVDAANPADTSTDQREHSRKDGPDLDHLTQADIGSFEYESYIHYLPLIAYP
jgi:hypothetical protein